LIKSNDTQIQLIDKTLDFIRIFSIVFERLKDL